MKIKFTLPAIMLIALLPHLLVAQNLTKPFQNSYFGFATGFYLFGQSPSEVKAGDLDNDGDSDLVVAQYGIASGFSVLINQSKGIYALPVKYNSAKAVQGIVIADFNKDGKKDVALTNAGISLDGNTVSVYFNTGKGKFGAPANYIVGSVPVGITAADFDNDGDNDLAVCNNYADSSNSISLLINKGNGTFNNTTNINGGQKTFRITSAKINNDNLPDLVIGNNTQNVTILYNSGNNNFSSRLTLNVLYNYPIDDGNATVRSADFDNDGDNDVIFASGFTRNDNNGQVALFSNKGNGSFNAPTFINLASFYGANDIDIADFNNDGKTDILSANYDGYQVILNQGSSNFSAQPIKPAGQTTFNVAAADADNDNKTDVITADQYSMQVTVHKNAGNASFSLPPFFATNSSSAGSLDAGDIDGDGDLDLVSSASSVGAVGSKVTVLKNNGNGTFTPGVAYSIRGGGVQAKFRDLNGDNKPDLIFATAISSPPYDFHTAINNGDGTFGARQTWSMNGCGWSDIEAIDVDGDGDRDAVITEWLGCLNVDFSGQRIFISKNNGSGSFGAPTIKIINPSPSCIATGDFNKDGKPDIATGHYLSVDVHLNSGNAAIFKTPVSYAVAQSPYDMIAVDLNNDGNLDLAACTEYDHEGMSVLLGNGDGTFKTAQNYNGAYSPDLRNESGITSGDVDADGDIDIMVGNYASNDVSVYLNKGNGTFVFRERLGMYYGVESPVYADFNGDGKKDIVAIVSIPNTGGQNNIALLKGNIFNASLQNKTVGNAQFTTSHTANNISVLSNPFKDYIDVKFAVAPNSKVKFILTNTAGVQVAANEANVTLNKYRSDIANRNLTSGVYILNIEVNGIKNSVLVMN